MTKTEMIARLARKLIYLNELKSRHAINTIFSEMENALIAGQRIELRGLGTFTLKRRDPHVSRNPRTGKSIQVEAKRIVYFRSAKRAHQRLNNTDGREVDN